jgi:hypothetical protein
MGGVEICEDAAETSATENLGSVTSSACGFTSVSVELAPEAGCSGAAAKDD